MPNKAVITRYTSNLELGIEYIGKGRRTKDKSVAESDYKDC